MGGERHDLVAVVLGSTVAANDTPNALARLSRLAGSTPKPSSAWITRPLPPPPPRSLDRNEFASGVAAAALGERLGRDPGPEMFAGTRARRIEARGPPRAGGRVPRSTRAARRSRSPTRAGRSAPDELRSSSPILAANAGDPIDTDARIASASAVCLITSSVAAPEKGPAPARDPQSTLESRGDGSIPRVEADAKRRQAAGLRAMPLGNCPSHCTGRLVGLFYRGPRPDVKIF